MKVFAVLVLLFGVLLPARADTVTVSATTCTSCFPFALMSIDLEAQFTVQPVLATGNFWDDGISDFFPIDIVIDQITAISGTFNGSPITLAPPLMGAGSWLGICCEIGTIYFEVNGQFGVIFNDNAFNFVDFANTDTPVYWNATDPSAPIPEPRTIWLLLTGLLLLLLYRKHNRSSFSVHR